MKVSKQIEEKVKTRPKGSFVFISDFTNEFDYEVARKILQRLTKKKDIANFGHWNLFVICVL